MGGGLGSFTEYTELLNINNIIAKYCPSEVFCSPSKWVSDNAPYGLIARKKDFKNKVVWLQCFKLFNTEYGIDEVFVGWVGLPLHPYNKHRQLYEEKKNIWIEAEIEGNINDRLRLRHETAKKVAEDSRFMSCKNKKEQKILLENMIIEGKIQNFNNSEIQDIITNARMIKDDKTE